MFHHIRETLSAVLILKDAQSAGLRRKDCEIYRDAFVPSAVFQSNMFVYYTAASRLRISGDNRPLGMRRGREGETLRRIAGFFSPYRGRLSFIGVLILVTVSIGVVNPILLKLIIDNLTGPQDLGLLWLQAGLMIILPIITSVSSSMPLDFRSSISAAIRGLLSGSMSSARASASQATWATRPSWRSKTRGNP